MDHDLAGLLENPSANLSLSHIKTYFQQLLKGTAYLHHVCHCSSCPFFRHKQTHAWIRTKFYTEISRPLTSSSTTKEYCKSPILVLLAVSRKTAAIIQHALSRDGIDRLNCFWANASIPRPLICGASGKSSTVLELFRPFVFFLANNALLENRCILGEILKGRPILQGSDDMDQLKRIFSLVGSPTEETMPGWRDLPDANKVHFDHYKGRMQIDFDECDPLAVDLLSKILVLDPKKRLTAMDALDHDFFFTEPAPARPEE